MNNIADYSSAYDELLKSKKDLESQAGSRKPLDKYKLPKETAIQVDLELIPMYKAKEEELTQ